MHMRAIDPSPHLRGDRDAPRMTTLGPSADSCRLGTGGSTPSPQARLVSGFKVFLCTGPITYLRAVPKT